MHLFITNLLFGFVQALILSGTPPFKLTFLDLWLLFPWLFLGSAPGLTHLFLLLDNDLPLIVLFFLLGRSLNLILLIFLSRFILLVEGFDAPGINFFLLLTIGTSTFLNLLRRGHFLSRLILLSHRLIDIFHHIWLSFSSLAPFILVPEAKIGVVLGWEDAAFLLLLFWFLEALALRIKTSLPLKIVVRCLA